MSTITPVYEILPAVSSKADAAGIEPSDGLLQALTEAFARVLGVSQVSVESDFFELGGDSILAMALALELTENCGMTVPAALLFDAPTPTAFVRAMTEQAGSTAGPLVPLKKGGQEPPIFLVPGFFGTPLEFTTFARLLDIPNPVYGLQARGLDGRQQPLRSIQDMAAWFLPSIQARQPHGPYLLGGNSMGGLTALELGRALLAAGEKVALLAIFDTMIKRRHLSFGQLVAVWHRRAWHHAVMARNHPLRYPAAFIVRHWHGGSSGPLPEDRVPPLWRGLKDVTAGARHAAITYRPQYYPGTITFFAATDDADWPVYPDITWRRLARSLRVLRINADHWGLFRAHVAETAGQFAEVVRLALETT